MTTILRSFEMTDRAQCTWNSLSACTTLITSFNTHSSSQGRVISQATKRSYLHSSWGNSLSFSKSAMESTVMSGSSRISNVKGARASFLDPQVGDHDRTPPVSTILEYLNPQAEVSRFADEAALIVSNLTSTWDLKPAALERYDVYKAVGLISCKHVYPKSVSAERLAAVSLVVSLFFLLDDICLDCSNSSTANIYVEDFGVDPLILQEKLQMERFWGRLKKVFKSSEMPSNCTAIEKSLWDAGRLIRSLSPSETWFLDFAENIQEVPLASIDFQVHAESILRNVQDIEACTELLIRMSGMRFSCDMIELTANAFMSAEARNDVQIGRLTDLCSRHVSLSNSLFSFDKKVSSQKKPVDNHIQEMMDHQNMSFPQAVRKLMNTIVAESIEFLEIERDPHVSHLISVDDGLRSYVEGLKYMYGGCFEFQITDGHYQSLNSPFPESL